MNVKSVLLAGALVVASAMAGSAATYNLGDVTSGATTTKTLTKQTVDFITFSLDAPSGFALSGLNITVKSKAGSNLRESIALYSGSSLVASATAALGSGGSTATLSFSGATALAEGIYTLGIAGWKATFSSDIANAKSTAFFNNGSYTVTITPSISVVPLPAGGVLMLTGLGAFAFARRKARKA